MKKRIWSILLVLCMALALFPFGALAANGLEGYAEVLNGYFDPERGRGGKSIAEQHDCYGTYFDVDGDGSLELVLVAPNPSMPDTYALDIFKLQDGEAKLVSHRYFLFAGEIEYSHAALLRSGDGKMAFMICGQNNTYLGTDEEGTDWYNSHFESAITLMEFGPEGWSFPADYAMARDEVRTDFDEEGYYSYLPSESTYKINNRNVSADQYYAWYDDFYSRYEIILELSPYEPLDGYPIEQLLAAAKGGFVDVPESAYYSMAVDWAVTRGVTNGTSPTTFSPNEFCTRGQVVTFLWRAAGSPAPKKEGNPFKDVSKGAYYYNAVLWAVENGITNGTSATTFSPGDSCTRSQVVTFLYRYAGSPEISAKNPFKDVQKGAYYYSAVQWAVKNGITNGTSDTAFSPSDTCTRGQVVTFLWRGTVHSAFPIQGSDT